MTHVTAYERASTANGSHLVTAYSAPPAGPPTSDAMCWRAWCCDSAVGNSSVRTTERTAEISAGPNSPTQAPVRRATPSRWEMVSAVASVATTSDA
jgi:hypothetical protein